MCADRLLAGRRQSAGAYESSFELAFFARTAGCVNVRGVGLNMANNPKKVKDPTEVALSAIQEALNISDTSVDPSRNSIGGELSPPSMPSAAPTYSDAMRPLVQLAAHAASVQRGTTNSRSFRG